MKMGSKLSFVTLMICTSFAPAAYSNLIVNGDFEAGNTGFSTAFVYMLGDITPAQTYDIVTDPRASHGSAATYSDHTTGTGNMMAVNGTESQTNALVWGQTVTVLPNTDYDFSVWTSTWFSQAGLEIKVNDSSLGSVFGTPSATGVWEETTRVWSSGASTSADIEIFNTTAAYVGNDFAIDDISFSVVPEPSSLGLVALGGLILARRRRKR